MFFSTLSVRIELQYLPSLEYFACLLKYGEVEIEAHEYFVKQTYRNRCHILTANGLDTLVIPVLHSGGKMPIREVKIDYSQSWVKRHWGAIVAAYGKAPYFEYFGSDFERIFQRKTTFLFDLNWELLTICLKLLRLNPTIRLSNVYNNEVENGHIDALSQIHPKKSHRHNNFYQSVVYQQNFGSEFVPNLSVIDLLMCQGAEATPILKRSLNVN